MKTILIKCEKCGRIKKDKLTNHPDLPVETAIVECNFCPKCDDSDWYEELILDDNGNLLELKDVNENFG